MAKANFDNYYTTDPFFSGRKATPTGIGAMNDRSLKNKDLSLINIAPYEHVIKNLGLRLGKSIPKCDAGGRNLTKAQCFTIGLRQELKRIKIKLDVVDIGLRDNVKKLSTSDQLQEYHEALIDISNRAPEFVTDEGHESINTEYVALMEQIILNNGLSVYGIDDEVTFTTKNDISALNNAYRAVDEWTSFINCYLNGTSMTAYANRGQDTGLKQKIDQHNNLKKLIMNSTMENKDAMLKEIDDRQLTNNVKYSQLNGQKTTTRYNFNDGFLQIRVAVYLAVAYNTYGNMDLLPSAFERGKSLFDKNKKLVFDTQIFGNVTKGEAGNPSVKSQYKNTSAQVQRMLTFSRKYLLHYNEPETLDEVMDPLEFTAYYNMLAKYVLADPWGIIPLMAKILHKPYFISYYMTEKKKIKIGNQGDFFTEVGHPISLKQIEYTSRGVPATDEDEEFVVLNSRPLNRSHSAIRFKSVKIMLETGNMNEKFDEEDYQNLDEEQQGAGALGTMVLPGEKEGSYSYKGKLYKIPMTVMNKLKSDFFITYVNGEFLKNKKPIKVQELEERIDALMTESTI